MKYVPSIWIPHARAALLFPCEIKNPSLFTFAQKLTVLALLPIGIISEEKDAKSSIPSNWIAPEPIFEPAALTHTEPPLSVPLFPIPDESVAVAPLPSSNVQYPMSPEPAPVGGAKPVVPLSGMFAMVSASAAMPAAKKKRSAFLNCVCIDIKNCGGEYNPCYCGVI